MLLEERELLVNRIVSGIQLINIQGQKYILSKPSKLDKYKACLEYERIKNECIFDGLFTKKQAENYLRYNKLWSDTEEQKLKDLDTSIDDLKVALYKSFLNAGKAKQLRIELKNANAIMGQLTEIKRSLDYATLEGLALAIKNHYLIAASLLYENEERVWVGDDFLDSDYFLLENVMKQCNDNLISITQFRELARSEPWRSIWQAGKQNIFDLSASSLTEEQKTLILFSEMYSNIYQHPNCPSDEIIQDDDAIDGFLISERRDYEKDKKTKQTDKLIPQKGDEVYLPVKNKNYQDNKYRAAPTWDIKEVEKLNSVEAMLTKKERAAVVREKGKVKEQNLPDVKRKIQTLATEKFRQTVKGK
jgi:hypothetical protein